MKRFPSKFEEKVLEAVSQISTGKVATYKFLARAVGRPKAVRAVGNALNKNPALIKTPCHRIVRSDGKVGGYRRGIRKKLLLLKKEGIEVDTKNKIKNLNKIIYKF